MATIAGRAIVPFSGDFSQLASGAAESVGGIGDMFKGVLGPVGLVVGAVAAVGGAAVDMASKYATSTDLMASTADITIAQAQKIGDAFLATGGQTTFSADQMMQAFAPVSGQLELVNGGALTAAQSTEFMSHAMDLAEATGGSLSDTTAALAKVMQAYSIPVGDAAQATNILDATSRSLNIPVSDLADTVDKLHAKLGPLAPSLDETSSLLVDLNSHGVTGARALGAVSTAANALLTPSRQGAEEIKKLGLNVFDASGNFVGFGGILDQLQPKLAGMTEQQRMTTENTLLGAGAFDKFDATIMAGLDGYNAANAAVMNGSTAQQSAAKATDNLAGMFDKLKSRVVDGVITLGDQFLPVLTTVGNWFLGPGITAIGGFATMFYTGFIQPIIGAVMIVLPPLMSAIGSLASDLLPALTSVFGALSVAWGAVAGALAQVAQAVLPPLIALFKVWITTVLPVLVTIFTTLATKVIPVLAAIFSVLAKEVLPPIINAFRSIAQEVGPPLMQLFTGIGNWIQQNKPLLLEIAQVVGNILGGAFTVLGDAIQVGIQVAIDAIHVLVGVITVTVGIITGVVNVATVVVKAIVTGVQVAVGIIQGEISVAAAIIGGIITGIGAVITAVGNVIGFVVGLISAYFKAVATVIGVEIGIVTTVISAIVGVVSGVVSTVGQIFGTIGSVITTAVGDVTAVFSAIFSGVAGVVSGVVSVIGEIFGTIGGIIGSITGGVADAFKVVVNAIIDVINFFIGAIDTVINGMNDVLGLIPTFGMGSVKIPDIGKIPHLYTGAFVDQPMPALIGDVPEFVMNVPQVASLINRASSHGGTAGGTGTGSVITLQPTYVITLNGTPEEMLAQVDARIGAHNAELLRNLELAS